MSGKASSPWLVPAALLTILSASAWAQEPEIEIYPESAVSQNDQEAEEPSAYTPGEAETGKEAICPVDGKAFKIQASTPALIHRGRTFFFDSKACEAQFRKDPDKFAAAAH